MFNTIILATSNQGKQLEIQALLSNTQCILQQDLQIASPPETGLSFIENALIKARHACTIANMPALADDSGLMVAALNDEPGIYSARFAGDNATDKDNIKLLLHKLVDTPHAERMATFYCAIALVRHPNDPAPIIATGTLSGYITESLQGNNGFGYDPIFYLPALQCTLAELSLELKNTISHRALALKNLQVYIDGIK